MLPILMVKAIMHVIQERIAEGIAVMNWKHRNLLFRVIIIIQNREKPGFRIKS